MVLWLASPRKFSSRDQENNGRVSLCFHMSNRNSWELNSSLWLTPWAEQDLRIKLRRVQIAIRENIPFTLIWHYSKDKLYRPRKWTLMPITHLTSLITIIAIILILTFEVFKSTERQGKNYLDVWFFQSTPISESHFFKSVKQKRKNPQQYLIDLLS